MAPAFHLSPAIFTPSPLTRAFGAGSTWRFITLHLQDHAHKLAHKWGNNQLFALNYLLRGTGKFCDSQGRNHRLQPGSIYQHFPGSTARVQLDPQANCAEFYLVFDLTTYDGLDRLQLIPRQEVLSTGVNLLVLEKYLRFHELCSQPYRETSRQLILAGLIDFLSLLYELALQSPQSDVWNEIIRAAALRLEEDIARRVPLPGLAQEFNVSYSSFRREFKRMMGIAPAEYRVRHRIETACHLLPTCTVKEVAEQLGYSDPFTFSSQFKDFTGISPSHFRRRTGQR